MNKFNLLNIVLKKYDEKMNDHYRVKEQNELIALFLKKPDESIYWYQKELNTTCNRDISKNELFIMKRLLWLNCKYFTNIFLQDVKILTHYLFTFYNENVTYYDKIISKMSELKKMTDSKNIYRNYDTKVYRAVLSLFFSNKVFADLEYKYVIKKCSGSYAKFLLEDLTEILAVRLGIDTVKKQKNHVVDKIKEYIEKLIQDDLPQKNREDYIARLEFELDNMRSSFSQIKELYDAQSKSIDEYKKVLEEETLVNFFRTLNDSKHGHILDQIAYTDQLVRDLNKKGIEFQSEIRSVPVLIKQLYKFIRSMGITPIKKLNDTYRVTVEDIEFTQYDGEPFYNEGEEKEVIVVSCGWTYNEHIISSPKLRELN